MRKLYNLKVVTLVLGAGLLLLCSAAAHAASPSISHSFKSSSGSLANGSLVSLDPRNPGYVQLANTTNGERLMGLVVANDGSLLAVNSTVTTTQVATAGTTAALVSDLNGSISVGDQISVSPFSGVGMKAPHGSRSIGFAQTAFSAKSPNATSKEVTDKSGRTTKLAVGYVNVNIGIGTVPNAGQSDNLNALQGLARSFTGHIVSTARIIFSIIIVLVTVMALIPLIYGAIYSGIVSVGRNPLAKNDILRSLASVLLVSVMLCGVAAIAVYLLLR